MLHSARMLLLMASDHSDCERVLAAASRLVCSAAWHGEPVWRHRHCECVLSCACRLQQAYSRVTPIVWLSWQLHAVTQWLLQQRFLQQPGIATVYVVLLCACRLPTSIQEDMELQHSPTVQSSARLQAAIAARLEYKQLLAMAVHVLSCCEAKL